MLARRRGRRMQERGTPKCCGRRIRACRTGRGWCLRHRIRCIRGQRHGGVAHEYGTTDAIAARQIRNGPIHCGPGKSKDAPSAYKMHRTDSLTMQTVWRLVWLQHAEAEAEATNRTKLPNATEA